MKYTAKVIVKGKGVVEMTLTATQLDRLLGKGVVLDYRKVRA